MKNPLAVIIPFFNPFDSELMESNLLNTLNHILKVWDHVFVVEIKYTDTSLNQKTLKDSIQKTKADYIQLKCRDALFHKEQMVNLVANEIIKDYEIIAYVDADILFDSPDWPIQIIKAFENFDLVQCFKKGYIRYKNEENKKAVYSYIRNFNKKNVASGSPGGTWAGTEKFWTTGLFDKMILGPNDSLLVEAISSEIGHDYSDFSFKDVRLSDRFNFELSKYRDLIKGFSVGFAPITVKFQFHSKPRVKQYGSRMLIMSGFDPEEEILTNGDGLYEWINPESERATLIRNYFESVHKKDIK